MAASESQTGDIFQSTYAIYRCILTTMSSRSRNFIHPAAEPSQETAWWRAWASYKFILSAEERSNEIQRMS